MDIRENAKRNIMNYVISHIPNSIEELKSEELLEILMNVFQDGIILEHNKYELVERCTEITVKDNSNEKLLRRFIATKRVAGTAESTIDRYYNMNIKLIDFINKPINDITTYDIRFYLSVKREKDGVSNRTLDGMRRCYSSFFGWLASEGYIPSNPCTSLEQIKYKKTIKNLTVQ